MGLSLVATMFRDGYEGYSSPLRPDNADDLETVLLSILGEIQDIEPGAEIRVAWPWWWDQGKRNYIGLAAFGEDMREVLASIASQRKCAFLVYSVPSEEVELVIRTHFMDLDELARQPEFGGW